MSALSDEPASEGAPDWMVSYADMITILMSFFAVMFSMAMSKDAKKDAPMIKSLHRQFGAQPPTFYFPFALTPKDPAKTIPRIEYRNRGPIADFAHASTSPFGDQATIGGVIYFDSGNSDLNEEQREQLQTLAKVLGRESWKIEILARTLGQLQDTDGKRGKNWNVARARCNNTMHYLASLGIDPARIHFGVAARFEPVHAAGGVLLQEKNDSVEVFTLDEFVENARALNQPATQENEFMAQAADPLAGADAATPVEKRRWFSPGIPGGIVAAIIILECATIYIYLARGHSPGIAEAHRAVAAGEHGQWRDVDLGKFSLTASDPESSDSLLIEFRLVGSVAVGRAEKETEGGAEINGFGAQESKSSDVAEDRNIAFETQFRHESSHFRDQVIAIIGNAQISALNDPDFEVLKAQILARTNSVLGKPLLKEIRFSEFAVVQQ